MRIITIFFLSGFSLDCIADDDFQKIAEQLIALRSEVENLNTQLLEKRIGYKNESSQLNLQLGDVEMSLGREELRVKELQAEVAKKKDEIDKLSVNQSALKPLASRALDILETHIATSLPFQKEKRRENCQRLRKKLEENVFVPMKVISEVWSFLEDEVRMAKETGLYRQSITIGSKQYLAEIAKVGMIAMYFSLENGRVGFYDTNSSEFRLAKTNTTRKAIDHLFKQLKRDMRTGEFILPKLEFDGV